VGPYDNELSVVLGRLAYVRPQVLRLHVHFRELSDRGATRRDIHSSVPSFVMFREELREFGFGDRSNLGL
jgi:hypothetical protein